MRGLAWWLHHLHWSLAAGYSTLVGWMEHGVASAHCREVGGLANYSIKGWPHEPPYCSGVAAPSSLCGGGGGCSTFLHHDTVAVKVESPLHSFYIYFFLVCRMC